MQSRSQVLRSLLLGGLLPVIAFTVAEQIYGIVGGLIAGVVFGVGEVIYELVRFRKVQGITIIGNLLVVGLGALSLLENDSSLFKLQPAILIFAFAGLLIGSSLLGKPFLVMLAKKQMPNAPEAAFQQMGAMNFRAGFCFIAIGLLSVEAAYHWSTAAWAALKGIGVPVIFGLYMLAEILIFRWRVKRGLIVNRQVRPDEAPNASPKNQP